MNAIRNMAIQATLKDNLGRVFSTFTFQLLSMTDFMSRTEIDPLLQVIMKSSVSSHVFMTSDIELNIVLKTFYEIVKE